MSKLTQVQKEQLRICIIDSSIKHLSTVETQQYIKEKIGVDIGVDYIWHLRGDIKRDTKKTFDELRKDRYIYLNSIFFDRVEELRYMQKVLHEVIDTNTDDGDVQIKAVNQLQSITNQLAQYYVALPNVAKYEVADINTLFPPNNNNSSTVVLNHNNNDDGSWWCTRGCNVYHKNEFGHHCPEFITGVEGEDKPGYFGGTPDEQRKF